MLEPHDGKLSRGVLRGERGREAPDLPGISRTENVEGGDSDGDDTTTIL